VSLAKTASSWESHISSCVRRHLVELNGKVMTVWLLITVGGGKA